MSQQIMQPIYNNYQPNMQPIPIPMMVGVGYSPPQNTNFPQISMIPQYHQPYPVYPPPVPVNPIQYAPSTMPYPYPYPYPAQIPPFYNVGQQVPVQMGYPYYTPPQQIPTTSPQQLYNGSNLMATNMQQIKTPNNPQQSQTFHSQQYTRPQQLQLQTTTTPQAIQTIITSAAVPRIQATVPQGRSECPVCFGSVAEDKDLQFCAFIECGHVTCETCASDLVKEKPAFCPLCRCMIVKRPLNIFL